VVTRKPLPPVLRARALAVAQREYAQKKLTARNAKRRRIATISLCTTTQALWLSTSLLPGAEFSGQAALASLAPWAFAGLGWVCLTKKTIEVDMRTSHQGDRDEQMAGAW
jgi:hypothetical protein